MSANLWAFIFLVNQSFKSNFFFSYQVNKTHGSLDLKLMKKLKAKETYCLVHILDWQDFQISDCFLEVSSWIWNLQRPLLENTYSWIPKVLAPLKLFFKALKCIWRLLDVPASIFHYWANLMWDFKTLLFWVFNIKLNNHLVGWSISR